MSLPIVVDMNLSPQWVEVLVEHWWPAVHWANVGNPRAADPAIMAWAVANHHVVFAHDLDFGTILALTHATGPSVLQIRAKNILPNHLATKMVVALNQYEAVLRAGAIVVVDESRARVRVLPL